MLRILALPAMLAVMVAISTRAMEEERAPASAPGGQHTTSARVGAPIAYRGLTVFAVYPSGPAVPSGRYLTLEEALARKLLDVEELPQAEVNRVSVTSRAAQPIYLMAGDMILGGKQDRIVARDTLVPPGAREFVVEVFCVEHGRWEGQMHFTAGDVASGSLRYEAQKTKEQTRVWERVAREARTLAAASASGSYRAVARNPVAQADTDATVRALAGPLSRDREAVGMIVAIHGTVVAADIFRDGDLFRKQLPRLLKSYALDAIQEKPAAAPSAHPRPPTAKEAQAFLQEAEAGESRAEAPSPTTANVERESGASVIYDLRNPSPLSGSLGGTFREEKPLHRAIFRKK
jgi:hypothetical protein